MSDALQKLIDAVEAGAFDNPNGPPRFNAFAQAWEEARGIYTEPSYKRPWLAYRGSLDIAKALHDALLPGWSYVLEDDDGNIHAAVWPTGEIGEQSGGAAKTTARAWLLAILRAYAAQQEPTP